MGRDGKNYERAEVSAERVARVWESRGDKVRLVDADGWIWWWELVGGFEKCGVRRFLKLLASCRFFL